MNYIAIIAYKSFEDSLISLEHAFFSSDTKAKDDIYDDAFQALTPIINKILMEQKRFYEFNWYFVRINDECNT